MRIFAGVPLGGASNSSGVVDDGNFLAIWVATSHFFGNVKDKARNITWRCATPCWPAIDCKMTDLE